jgi:hypothetical protein
MSVAEIIEQIKGLPVEEQREVSRILIERLQPKTDVPAPSSAREPIESIATRIFDRYDPLFRKLAE